MKELWDQLYHRKKERTGLSVLLLLIVLALGLRFYYLKYSEPNNEKYSDLIKDVVFVDIDEENATVQKKHKKKLAPALRFYFDPNSLSADSFALLGLPKYVGTNIEKYRTKGGKFRKPTDLKKIYGLENYYDNISSLIKIKKTASLSSSIDSATSKKKVKFSPVYKKKETESRRVIELNTADSTDLLLLKGIGPFYAKTILEMRQKLGGYVNAKQLTEAYGVPDTILKSIGPEWLKIDLSLIRKLNINTADFITLVKHPYINKNQTNAILAYRKAHGGFTDTEEIKKIHLISEEDYAKLRWYLEI